jgi:hypothetical protein
MTAYKCNLVIPGAAKSGTSSLHDLLDQHPDIAMSKPKEPQHFSFDALYERGAEVHNRIFRHGGTCRYRGESSQCYMIHPVAMRRIKEHLRSPKIILLLRHPVDRLWSQYRWNYRLTVERAPLMQALAERGDDTGYSFDPIVGMYREHGGYLSLSRYSHWVPLWIETFGQDNVLVQRFEDLQADPAAVLARCWAFLDLAPVDIPERPRRNETSRTNRLPPLPVAQMERRLPRAVRKSRFYALPRARLLGMFTPDPPKDMSVAEAAHVRACLREDIAFHESLRT